jgi:hypothetical protein
MVSKSWELRFGVCHEMVKRIRGFIKSSLVVDFVEKQHEIRSPDWSGKTTESLASPSDCYQPRLFLIKAPYKKFIVPAVFELGI